VSSGSARPSAPAETVSMAKGANSADISLTLPRLWLATTSRSSVKRRGIGSAKAQCGPLASGELGYTRAREPQHLGEERLVKRGTFSCRLDLDDPARSGQHEICVGFGL